MKLEELKNYRHLVEEIQEENDILKELETIITSPRTPNMEGMPQGGTITDRTEAIVKYLTIKEDYYKKIDAVKELLGRIDVKLDQLPEQERNVLRLTYVMGLNNTDIGDKLHFSIRTVQRIRARGEYLFEPEDH